MIEPHLDNTALAALRDIMLDGFDLLVSTFVTDGTQRLEVMQRSLAANDPYTFSRAAHSLKGSASNMAAPCLAALCYQLELMGREGRLEGCAPVLAAVEQEFATVRDLLQQRCNPSP